MLYGGECVEVKNEKDGRVILKRNDGVLFFIDDEGFEMKDPTSKQIKTTEWVDWIAMNNLINKITSGPPKRRS